jgi:hypothetical protein
MGKKVFKSAPKHHLVDNPLPNLSILDAKMPHLPWMLQNPEMGWNASCVPTRAGRKVNEFVDGQGKFHLVQNIAHAKRWITEKVRGYIDGYLPTWLRRPKYALDVIKLLRYIRRLVATYNFWQAVVNKEIDLANNYIAQCQAVINYGKTTLSPASLRSEFENEIAEIWDNAINDLNKQVEENNRSRCLI